MDHSTRWIAIALVALGVSFALRLVASWSEKRAAARALQIVKRFGAPS